MSNSGDSLIISLFAITSTAAIILIGTFTFSRIVLRRYSAVVHRLYNLSFKGVDTERKRIASELHDQLGAHWVRMSHNFERLKTELNAEQLIALNQLEVDYQLFKDKTHQIVEFMYPKGLATPNWKTSFKSMALQMSMGNVRVFFESHAERHPSENFLHHAYWAVQEILTNAIKHAHVSRIQISTVDEEGVLNIMVVYRATPEAVKWITGKRNAKGGFGTLIIGDRLRIIGAKQKITVQDQVVTHTISVPYENSDS